MSGKSAVVHFTLGLSLLASSAHAELPPYIPNPNLQAHAQACLVSVCGPAETNWTTNNYLQRRGGQDQNVVKLWKQDLQPQLGKILNKREQAWIAMAQTIPSVIQKGANIKLTEGSHAMLVFWKLRFVLLNEGAKVVKKSPLTQLYTVDESALRALLSVRPSEEHQVLTMLAYWQAQLQNDTQITRASADEDPVMKRVQALYPGLSIDEAQKKDASNLLIKGRRLQAMFIKELGENIYGSSLLGIFERAAAGADLSEAESKDYVFNALAIESTDRLMSNEKNYRMLMAVSFDIAGELATLQASGKLQDHLQVDQRERVTNAMKDLSAVCEKQLHDSLNANASKLRYRKLFEIAEDVRAASKVVAAKLVSPEGQEAVQKRLDTMTFTHPSTNEERIRDVRRAFDREEEASALQLNMAMTPGTERDQKLLFRLISMNYRTIGDEFYGGNPVKGACGNLPVQGISDFSAPARGKVALSWFSANYPYAGVAILAHEVGHVVSHELRNQRKKSGILNPGFTNSYNCVSQRNPFNPSDLLVNAEGIKITNWSEEDWADHFSSMVMEELKASGSAAYTDRNKSCALLDQKDGIYESSLKAKPQDPHSSALLRILMIAFDRKSVTPECQPFINDFKRGRRQLQCE